MKVTQDQLESITALIDELKAIRRVRTPEGVEHFGKPIGTPIVRDVPFVSTALLSHPAVTSLPPALGEAPLPDGFVRMYHMTPMDNLPNVLENGLRVDRAQNREGVLGVWVSDSPYFTDRTGRATIELAIPSDLRAQIGAVDAIDYDISPEQFLTVNEEWHDRVRQFVQDERRMDELANGEYDVIIDNEDETIRNDPSVVATRYIRDNILTSNSEINKEDILSGLSKMALNYENFEDFSKDYSLNGIRPRVWHTTEDPDFNVDESYRPKGPSGAPVLEPVFFTTDDPEIWGEYTADREYVVEYDISDLIYGLDKDYYTDQTNDGLIILPSGYSKLKRVGIFSSEEAQNRSETQRRLIPKSKGELFEIWNSSVNTLDTDKNETGNYAEKFKAAKETGEQIGLTKETFEQIKRDKDAGNLAQYGLTDESSSLLLRALELREERLFQQNKRFNFMSKQQRENLANNMDELRSSGTIMIAMNNDAAEQVLQDGVFKSQFETNTSNGMLGEEVRSINETAAHDIHPEINPRLRPIYGYVAGENLTPFNVINYGEIRFELEDYVKERATMTDGDSLGSPATPVRMTGPPLTEREAVAASFGWNGEMYDYLGDDIFSYMDAVSNSEDGGYVETQILGGVSIRDVKTIYVPDESTSFTFDLESFTELAEKLGISVVTYVS